jgi:hypothetical protein
MVRVRLYVIYRFVGSFSGRQKKCIFLIQINLIRNEICKNNRRELNENLFSGGLKNGHVLLPM